MKRPFTRSQCKALQSEFPVGDPHSGPAYGQKRDFVGDLVGDVFGGITGASQQADAASAASATQAAASAAGIAEQQRQFDKLVQLMSPYVSAGGRALTGMEGIAGLGGAPAQQSAISAIQGGPEFGALMQQGENAILQNASATGGLRGGNVQGALAQFRPQLLSQLINQQYGRLGGITQLGQAAAAGQAAAGMNTGANVANLLAQQGAATAGGQLAQGSVVGNTFGTLANVAGAIYGAGGFGGAPTPAGASPSSLAAFGPSNAALGSGMYKFGGF